ncbi:MAG: F0F1 ATP synthase subunit alpha, partial [Desulfotignum sp.]
PDQIAVLIALTHGVLDDIALSDMAEAQKKIRQAANADHQEMMDNIARAKKIDEKAIDALVQTAQKAVKPYRKESSDADTDTA